jgi:Pyruvate/2-oxoacid:ferredoxin oxidoreductase gamma subunit
VANVVMLGALLEETECLPTETALSVLQQTVKNPKILELDKQALTAGRDFVDNQIRVGAVPGPDGYTY